MEQHVFSCYRGHYRKGIVIYNAASVIYNKTFSWINKKYFLITAQRFETELFITFKEQCVFKLMEGSSEKLKGIAV
jgi:hypothetical protein